MPELVRVGYYVKSVFQKMKTENSQKPNYGALSATTLGITMAVGVGVFTYLGYRIGKKLGKEEAGTLIGIFVGLFYCGYEVWKLIKRTNNAER